jgi:hypothetical protein
MKSDGKLALKSEGMFTKEWRPSLRCSQKVKN